jgi:hypothetical protein
MVELCPTAIQYTEILEGSNVNKRVEDEKAGRKVIGSSINVSSE